MNSPKIFRIAFFLLLLVLPLITAIPPLPTEYYGAIYQAEGVPAEAGNVITIHNSGGTQCGPSFTVVNPGFFGLLTCPGNDPDTVASEGLSDGQVINVRFNGIPAQYLAGENTTDGGDFHFLNISYPVPVCGDFICDPFFENEINCVADCSVNGSGGNGSNETGKNETSGNDTTSAPPPTSTPSGSSGGGSGSNFNAGLQTTVLDRIFSLLPKTAISEGATSCIALWDCGEWGKCGIDGLRERECIDEKSCGSTADRPSTAEECEYIPSCYNGIQDFVETDVDCGGPCQPCASCTNKIQDCHVLSDETLLCEEGIDCGGACRSCDSCFNGEQDWTETGVDCGGQYCDSCTVRPTLAFPNLICEKSMNPLTNAGLSFFIALLLLLSVRVYFYLKRIDQLHVTHDLDEYVRTKQYYAERRKMVLFVLIAVFIAVLAYLYYYEFLLCSLEYSYLWWFALLLVLVPLLIYELWRFMEYRDKEKLLALGSVVREHADAMDKMLGIENQQLVEIEGEVREIIERISKNRVLHGELQQFTELRTIYKDIIKLYYAYQSSKSPFGIERELCKQVYAIETNKQFQELAGKYPDFWLLFERLKLLYHHYESKQVVYDQIQEEKDRQQKHAAGIEEPVKEEDAERSNEEKKE